MFFFPLLVGSRAGKRHAPPRRGQDGKEWDGRVSSDCGDETEGSNNISPFCSRLLDYISHSPQISRSLTKAGRTLGIVV